MIKVTNQRNNGVECEPLVHQKDPIEALAQLAFCELSFGSRVEKLERNDGLVTLVTRTVVMAGLVDTATFEGGFEDMMPCLRFLHMMFAHNEHHRTPLIDQMAQEDYAFGSLSRDDIFKTTFLISAGIEDHKVIARALAFHYNDLIAALQLARDGACTFREALSL